VTAALQRIPRELSKDFEQMFLAHHDLVYRAAYRITGSAQDAEDVLQTLFLRLLRRECPPDIEKNPKGYLHRAAVNIALDVIKARSRVVSDGNLDIAVESVPGADDIQKCVRLALAELNPKAAEIFVLRHVEGFDNAEIAKMLGTTRGTVAVLLFRARMRLKKSIRAQLGEKS
jgi:RNA polymerase sigma-70 factor, ECF subfamily